jgi:hypothetical protein
MKKCEITGTPPRRARQLLDLPKQQSDERQDAKSAKIKRQEDLGRFVLSSLVVPLGGLGVLAFNGIS